MKLQKILTACLLVAAIALVGIFALPTDAQAVVEGCYTYQVSDGEAIIADCDTDISGDITIPSTLGGYPVTGIGDHAFEYCTGLKDVYYAADEAKWDQITIGEGNDCLKNATIHYNYVPGVTSMPEFTGDGQVTDADAIYLLRYTLFPDNYPLSGNGDVNSDGRITDADAIYLLRHTLFPTQYPLYPGSDGTDSQLKTIEAGKLIMATNAAFPPYEMTTDGGGFEGIDIEIAQAVADKLGLELVIRDMAFDEMFLSVREGKSDIAMAGITATAERMDYMDFTDSYTTCTLVVIAKEGSDVTMDNLGEKVIGAQRGTTGYIYASDPPEYGGYGAHVKGYDNGTTAVQALIDGQVDCVIIDSAPAAEYVKANAGLTILEGEWVVENYAIGCTKGNTQLVDAINKALAELIADGTVQKIVDKYITAK